MSFTNEQLAILSGPLDKGNVKERTNYGGGGKLSYLESWFVIQEANRVFGFDGWSRETISIERVATTPYSKNGKEMIAVSYMARVRVTVGDVVREGCGYGDGQGQVDKAGAAHELALKEAESDAMKRAFMTFGNPFGLALYDKAQSNVADTAAIEREKASKAKSREAFERIIQTLRDCVTPEDYNTAWKSLKSDVAAQPHDWQAEIIKERNEIKHRILDKQAAV